jgi:hypothetical protein
VRGPKWSELVERRGKASVAVIVAPVRYTICEVISGAVKYQSMEERYPNYSEKETLFSTRGV